VHVYSTFIASRRAEVSRGVDVDWAQIRQEKPGQVEMSRGFRERGRPVIRARRNPSVTGSSPVRPTVSTKDITFTFP